jgi:hypothetical protein
MLALAIISTAFHRQQVFENPPSPFITTTCRRLAVGHPSAFPINVDGGTDTTAPLLMKERKRKMNIRFNALWVSASLTLMGCMIAPAIADEWNKETKVEFSAPVEVPGKVLDAGKYVFKLADSESDRNIVQIFSEDASGDQKLVTTVLAIPAYRTATPDDSIIKFEERSSGSPEAIQSWFYPGDNAGWEFVYPKRQTLETSANMTPASAAVATTAAQSLPPAPEVEEQNQVPEAATVEEEVVVAQNDALVPPLAQDTDTQNSADRILPQTGGYSELQLMTGLFMLGGGIAALFASRRKFLA